MRYRLGVLGIGLGIGCSGGDDESPMATIAPVVDPLLAPTQSLSVDEMFDVAESFFQSNTKLLEGVDVLSLKSAGLDGRGLGHVHYEQQYGGLPVWGGEAIVHVAPSGTMFRFTDSLVRDIEVSIENAISQDQAIEIASSLQHPGASDIESPEARQMVARIGGSDHLIWHVEAYIDEPPNVISKPIYLIDAHDGTVLKQYEGLTSTSLSDSDQTVYDNRNSTRINRAVVGDSSDTELAMTYDSVSAALAFLSNEYSRDSYDNAGAVVRSYGHYSRRYVNAFWDGSRLVFGDGDGAVSDYLGVLDIASHELGHALTEYEADLIYADESGALNEASSDIFAARVEAYVDGTVDSTTWSLGEDCWLADTALRYMDAPSDDGSSYDHYSARYQGSSDNGGVHWNSGIANHFFYLLTEGGTHHNAAYRSGYSVGGIGISDAYSIWYSALNDYMTSSTSFDGARTATESACAGLGFSSSVCSDVSVAWYEVGVGSDPGGDGGGSGGGGDTGTGGDSTGGDGGDTGAGSGGGTGGGDTGTGGGGGTSLTCDAGWTRIESTLAVTGADEQFSYTTSSRATHQFELAGPSGTDFDLNLYRANKRGNYSVVDSSTGSTSSEQISYTGKSGDYLLQVISYTGSGDYVVCYRIQ